MYSITYMGYQKPSKSDPQRQSWRTPRDLFDQLDAFYHFSIDTCASKENALCERYWDEELDCRKQDWTTERAFCNPPFSFAKEILPRAKTAQLAVVLLPLTALVSLYVSENPPKLILVPPRRIKFTTPDGLSEQYGPSLGTVMLVYGTQEYPEMGFLALDVRSGVPM